MLQRHAAATRAASPGRAGRLRAAGSWAVFAVMLALAVFLWPHQWGGRTSLTIVSGHSMDGTYATGDLIVGRSGTAEIGDIVVFRPPGVDGYVVHRIVGGDAESGWVTRGDNNSWDDPWRPTADDVVGVAQWRVPHAWALVSLATSPVAIVAYGLVVVGVFVWPSRRVVEGAAAEADAAADAATSRAEAVHDEPADAPTEGAEAPHDERERTVR